MKIKKIACVLVKPACPTGQQKSNNGAERNEKLKQAAPVNESNKMKETLHGRPRIGSRCMSHEEF